MDRRVAPLLLLSACLWIGPGDHAQRLDGDGDGVPLPSDCDDADPLVSPRVAEVACDGRDNDCDPDTPDGPASIEGRSYGSIGAAIDAAVIGDVIEICTGTISEAVVVDKPLTLSGIGSAESTIIDASEIGAPVVRVTGTGVTLRQLTLTGGTGGPNTTPLPGSTAGGGVLAVEAAGTVAIVDCIVEGNEADVGGGVVGPLNGELQLTGTVVRGNRADGSAGGVAVFSNATLSTSTLEGNEAVVDGGGLWAADGVLVAADLATVVSGNSAARGGGAFLGEGTTWTSATFDGNNASADGGGVYGVDATVAATTLTGNSAVQGGGAAVVGRMEECTVTGNQATRGGGVYAAGDLFIGGGVLSGNQATEVGGGALVTLGTLVIEEDAEIEANQAESGGGLASVDGALDILEASVEGNTAVSGAGLYILDQGGCPVGAGCVSTVTSATMVNNDATGQGGGVWSNHNTTLSGCTIRANTAAEGAGVHIQEPGSATLSAAVLQANSATIRGGGLHVESGAAATVVTGGEISDNTGDGAAIYVSLGQVTCQGNAEIRDNFAPGDAAVSIDQGDGALGPNTYISTGCQYFGASDDVKVQIGYDADDLGLNFTCVWGASTGPSCD